MIYKVSHSLLKFLTRSGKRRFVGLVFVLAFASMLEAFGILSVMPFIAVVSDPGFAGKIANYPLVGPLMGTIAADKLIVTLGAIFIVILCCVSSVAALSNLMLIRLTYRQEEVLSRELFEKYLKFNFETYATRDTSELSKNILHETHKVVHGVLVPWLVLISKSFSGFALICVLLLVNWQAAISSAILLGAVYLIVYASVQKSLQRNGSLAFEANTRRYQVVNEAIGGLKEIEHYGLGSRFSKLYRNDVSEYVTALMRSDIVASLPRYVFEVVVMSTAVIAVTIVGVRGGLLQYLPTISVFALVSLRLMPIFHQVFNSISVIKFNERSMLPVFGEILDAAQLASSDCIFEPLASDATIEISLENVTYRYPAANTAALRAVSLSIPARGLTCVVGPSGSGKSTLIDLLAGTLYPESGTVLLNGKPLSSTQRHQLRTVVGLASQHTPLFLGTISENITLWPNADSIDSALYSQCVAIACLDDMIEEFGAGRRLGEGGRSVSGGQRQRIGIARALYRIPKLLILDEPTSALDEATAATLISNLGKLSKAMPIVVVTHDAKMMQIADDLVMLKQGQLISRKGAIGCSAAGSNLVAFD